MNQKELKKKIFEKKSSLSDEEVFLGNPYRRFIERMVEGVTNHFQKKIGINIKKDTNENSRVAYTDSKSVTINAWHPDFTYGASRVQRNNVVLGLSLHECGHILFTNFRLNKESETALGDGNTLYPLPDRSDISTEFLGWLKAFEAGRSLQKIYHIIDNCVEDGYIEKRLLSLVPGYGDSLRYIRKIQEADAKSYEEQKEEGLKPVTILTNLVLIQAKYGHVKIDEAYTDDETVKTFYRIRPLIDAAVDEKSSFFRKKKVNELFCHFYSILKEMLEKDDEDESQGDPQNSGSNSDGDSGDGSQSSGQDDGENGDQESEGSGQPKQSESDDPNGDRSEEEDDKEGSSSNSGISEESEQENSKDPEELAKKLKELAEQLGDDCEGMGDQTSRDESDEQSSPAGDQAESGSISESEDDGQNANSSSMSDSNSAPDCSGKDRSMESIEEETAKEEVAEEKEKELSRELQTATREIAHDASIHNGISCNVHRAVPDSQKYEEEHAGLDNIARRMMKNLLKEIKDRQIGDAMDGFYIGNRLNTAQLYRKDKKLMIRDVLPEDIPDMEICILVDQSGSMSGERIESARKCAYVTYSFCRMLGIPVSVLGHNALFGHVSLFSYADSESIDGKDGQRIFSIDWKNECNRDGYAVRYCLNRLRKSQANDRYLMIISDGMPNDDGYGMNEGKADLQDAVAKARKEDISVITAAIGEDADQVRHVYTDGVSERRRAMFLDIADLEKLPKTFVKIIKESLAA